MLLKLKMMPFMHKNAMNYHGCLQILFMILQEKVIEPDDIRKGFMEIHMIIQEENSKKYTR